MRHFGRRFEQRSLWSLEFTYGRVLTMKVKKEIELKNILREERGATMLEYALLAALIALVAVPSITALGTSTRDTFHTAGNNMAGAHIPGPPPGLP